jgi:lipase
VRPRIREYGLERRQVRVDVVEDGEQRPTRFSHVTPASLHVRSWGDPSGIAIVYLHGLSATGEQIRRLAETRLQAFHVLAPDLRGHGESPKEPPWNLETVVEDVLAAAPDSAIWIGLSFGGRIALEIAARAPDRIERLVLLDPVPRLPPHVAYDMAEHTARSRTWATADAAVRAHLPPNEYAVAEVRANLVEEDGAWRWRYSPAAAAAMLGELARPVPPPRPVSTLLLTGRDSYYLLEDERAALEQALGDQLQTVTVAAGHGVLWEAFDEVADAVLQFLEDSRSQS